MRRNRQSGMTLVEILSVMGVFVAIVMLLAQATTLAAASAAKSKSTADSMTASRKAIDNVIQTVRLSDMVLAQYPSGTPSFKSNETTTLILRAPTANAAGDLVPGAYGVTVFQLVPNASPAGTKSLRRYTATIVGGVESAPVLAETVCQNISGAYFGYVTEETFYGDHWTTTYNLLGTPLGTNSVVVEKVMIGGKNRLDDGKATITGKTVTTFKALTWNVPMDVVYRTNPQEVVNPDGGCAVTSLILRMKALNIWSKGGGGSDSREVVYNTRLSLLNR